LSYKEKIMKLYICGMPEPAVFETVLPELQTCGRFDATSLSMITLEEINGGRI